MGKLARDIVLLAQSEVAECSEGGDGERGGLHDAAQAQSGRGGGRACVCRPDPGTGRRMLSSMVQEHERGAGSWQAECQPMLGLLALTGSAAHATAELLEGLEVDSRRMRANLEAAGAEFMSESLVGALADHLGRAEAGQRLREAAQRAHEQGDRWGRCSTRMSWCSVHSAEGVCRRHWTPSATWG